MNPNPEFFTGLNDSASALAAAASSAFGRDASGFVTGDASGVPTLVDEVAFISGVSADGTLPLQAYRAWNSDNPASYGGGYTNSLKWGGTAAGATAGTPGGTVYYYFNPISNWTGTEQSDLAAGLALWSAVSNIAFVQTTSSAQAQITFTRGTNGTAQTSAGAEGSGTAGQTGSSVLLTMTNAKISIDTSVAGFGPINGSFTQNGGYPWEVLIHEEGHAIGLGHAGPYNNKVNASTQQFSPYDSRLWSIMSYINPSTTSAEYYNQYPVTGTSWRSEYATTWMPLDILAAQSLYGLPTSTPLSGGQVFGFNTNISGAIRQFFDFTINTTPVVTIWDMGLNNTLDLSGWSSPSNVNLNPGTFSSADNMINNIAIAFNTAIDTFVDGSGNDVVTANNDGDTIYGGGGNDTLMGGAGNDYLDGGPGNDYLDGGPGYDVASYAAATSGVNVDLSLSGPQNTSGGVTDTLVNIEYLFGSAYDDTLSGDGVHSTYLSGGAGNDTLIAGGGAGSLYGGDGNDVLVGGPGNDYLDGGPGYDVASYAAATSGVNVDLSLSGPQNTSGGVTDTLVNIEYLFGSAYDDTLSGDGVHSTISLAVLATTR